MSDIEHPLAGGVANAGRVVRVGDTVRRPAGPHTDAIFALLRHLADAGFDGAPRPLGRDERGREVLTYLPGAVPIAPFPAWSMTDEALVSVARLLRRFHEAGAGFDAAAHAWSTEMADPQGGSLLCHCDVCPENVVFRDGEAVGLLDFEFVAPGRRVWDVAATMGMWASLRPGDERSEGMESLDALARARVFADAYGLARAERTGLVDVLIERRALRFLEQRVAAGEPQFVAMWEAHGGERSGARIADWQAAHRERLNASLID